MMLAQANNQLTPNIEHSTCRIPLYIGDFALFEWWRGFQYFRGRDYTHTVPYTYLLASEARLYPENSEVFEEWTSLRAFELSRLPEVIVS